MKSSRASGAGLAMRLMAILPLVDAATQSVAPMVGPSSRVELLVFPTEVCDKRVTASRQKAQRESERERQRHRKRERERENENRAAEECRVLSIDRPTKVVHVATADQTTLIENQSYQRLPSPGPYFAVQLPLPVAMQTHGGAAPFAVPAALPPPRQRCEQLAAHGLGGGGAGGIDASATQRKPTVAARS